MSLDVYLKVVQPTTVFSSNITHNLGKMAAKAGVYRALWRPEELGAVFARELIPTLEKGLDALLRDPEGFKEMEPPNRWGTYEGLVKFVEEYLAACRENPDAEVVVSR